MLLVGLILAVIAIGGILFLWQQNHEAVLVPPTEIATSTPITTATTTPPASETPAPATGPYKNVVLALHTTRTFYGDLVLTPTEVLEDSRCPVDVQCIQKGTVRLSVNVTSNGTKSTQVLTEGQPLHLNGINITLVSVTPNKHAASSISSSEYRFTLTVEKGSAPVAAKCYVGGCSSEICSDQPGMASTCIYTASYVCYQTARCERQTNGSCGWTQTATLTACLANPPA